MKTGILAILCALLLSAPAFAAEGRAACVADPASAPVADDVAGKLPAEGQTVPDDFYVILACALMGTGLSAGEIAALPSDVLLDEAVDGLTLDRSRADALLAILQAMKQAQVVRPEPQVVK